MQKQDGVVILDLVVVALIHAGHLHVRAVGVALPLGAALLTNVKGEVLEDVVHVA